MSAHLEGLGLVDLLDLLEPVPEPMAVPLTPQTPGWIVLGLVVVAIGWWIGARALRHWRANAYRRAALARLAQCGDDPAELARLVRQTALAGFGRRAVAARTGADWLAFLDATVGGTGFSEGPGRVLIRAPYSPDSTPDAALTALVRDWIRGHRVPDGVRG